MLEKLIIHIPHASLKLPNEFYNRILVDAEEIEEENIFMSDYLVDKFAADKCENIVKFEFSRLFCDVERFKDDKLEKMTKYGMGVIYEKNHKGNVFIKLDSKYKDEVIRKYYDIHHELLDNLVTRILDRYDKCYIVDLHSFSDECVKQLFDLENNPDICIGYDEGFCDKDLIYKTTKHFESYGYKVKHNYPYSGSLIPNKYYNSNDSRIFSIMIEINKRVYLDENVLLNNDKYLKLKKCMDEYYEIFEEY